MLQRVKTIKRSVIQIANSTHLISLPREWVKRFNIKKGEELDVDDRGNHILVTTSRDFEIKKTEIDVSPLNGMIKDLLYGLYKVGYEEVKLNYLDPKDSEKIQKLLRNEMIGFEIIEQRNDYCIIKSVAGGFETEFDNMFRRTFLLLKAMAEDIQKSMENGDISLIASIKLNEVSTNKYTAFCRRIIQKKGYKDMRRSILMYMVVEEIEKTADEYKYLCDYFTDSKGKGIKQIRKDILQLFSLLNSFMDKVYNTYYNFSLQEANELLRFRKKFINDIHEKTTAFTGRDGRLGHYLVNITQQLTNVLCFKMEMEL